MSIAEAAGLRAVADELGISETELASLRQAKLSDTTAFYLGLRCALCSEFDDGKPFHLPARKLASHSFLPGRRDRKLYMRLTNELVRLGLIERVEVAGFAADGRRVGALFMFTPRPTTRSGNIVFLAAHRRRV
jgi:hypothetical protein